MAGEWREVTLAEVSDNVTVGHVGLMADQYVARGVPFLRSLNIEPFTIKTDSLKYITSEFHSRLKKSALKPGDVVIIRTGKPGVCAVVPDWLTEANCSDLVIVRTSKQVRPSFISYVINSVAQHHIGAYTVGAVQQHFNVGSARTLRFMIPSLVEQDRIIELLDAIQEKIELNRRMAETLEAMARALFQSWFVDFDPIHAKRRGGQFGLSEGLAALFSNCLEKDGVPKNWFRASLSNLVFLERATQDPTVLGEALVDHFSLPAFDAGRRPIREPASGIKSLKVSVDPPLVLFSKLNPETPRVWPVLTKTGETMLASTEFLALRPRPDRAPLSFIASLLASNAFRDKAAGMVTGTSKSHQRVQPGSLLESTWIIPTASVLAAFDEIASPMLSRAVAARNQRDILAALRNTLLPKLISGDLRVADAEQRIAAA